MSGKKSAPGKEGILSWSSGRFLLGIILLLASLWISFNALRQTRQTLPGETLDQALRAMLFGRPVLSRTICPEEVHAKYTTTGPDGQTYPTWHPPVDLEHGCYFDHEHGSDPGSYLGFEHSGMPAFGYTAAQAGISEPHAGYKVFVSNDDLNGRAWMITLNMDTSGPRRAVERYHSLDWHISSLEGKELVHARVMADFGHSTPNCSSDVIFSQGETGESRFRSMPTAGCALHNSYEHWVGAAEVGGVFKVAPLFEVDNPVTAVDLDDLEKILPMCALRPAEGGCASSFWSGSRRGVLRPGQRVKNLGGEEVFYTDAFGKRVDEESPGAIPQYVIGENWDSWQCCGAEVVFRIQTYSAGTYIPAPPEPAGSTEFWKLTR
jgi:hypothetical protein